MNPAEATVVLLPQRPRPLEDDRHAKDVRFGRKSAFTFRAVILGTICASVNSSVNMYFNFRYAGGLGQYWVIIVSYVILKGLDKIKFAPRAAALLPRFMNPGPISQQEHCVIMLAGAAAAFQQSLGLSGGLCPISLFYRGGENFPLWQLFIWTFIAAFFGVFLGFLYGYILVRDDKYPWPIAQMNAVTIRSFHFQNDYGDQPAIESSAVVDNASSLPTDTTRRPHATSVTFDPRTTVYTVPTTHDGPVQTE